MSLIDTRSLTDRVYEYLLDRIITGAITYGDVINIRRIADELKISTMPVREALKRLDFERIVEIKPRSNCQVRVPSRETIAEVYELRELLEAHAISKFLEDPQPSRLGDLWSIVRQMREVDAEADPAVKEKKAVSLDRQFHSEICRLAGNEYINHVFRQLSLQVNMTLIHQKTYYRLESQYYESHAVIVRCLEKRPKDALTVLRRHFTNVKDILFDRGQVEGRQAGAKQAGEGTQRR